MAEVDHPEHYNKNPSGVECIDVVEHMTFNVGNAVKYCWRAGEKDDEIVDLRKARWYLAREIGRLIAERQQAAVDRLDSLEGLEDAVDDQSHSDS